MNRSSDINSYISRLIVLVLLFSSCTMLQRRTPLMRSGDKLFLQGDYRDAAGVYEQVLVTEPANAKALYKAGISYMTFDKEKAAEYLYKAYNRDPLVDADILFWLGRAEHINYRFDKAIDLYQSYYEGLSRFNKQRKEEALRLKEQAQNAKEAVASPKDIFVENLGKTVNTMYSEHSPVISSDDNYLLFTTRSREVTGGEEAVDGEFFEDVFETTRNTDGTWGVPTPVSGALNSPGHDASIQLFDNDTKMLLYRASNGGDIYLSERQADGTWGAPKSISDQVNSKFYESDAYITPDKNKLYFSTSQFSKGDNLDIYMVERQPDGNWGEPRSLGDGINTPFDEDSPFLASDGSLYFSSRGHNTMGGYDIFVSKYDSVARQWGKPVNMGVPVNSPDDDIYYRLSHDGSYAYLSSYRIGGQGEKDIYTISYIRPAKIVGAVYSKQDSMAVAGIDVKLSGTQANQEEITFTATTNPDSGAFELTPLSGRSYKVELLKDGKVIATEKMEVPMVLTDKDPIRKDFYINTSSNTRLKSSKTTKDSRK